LSFAQSFDEAHSIINHVQVNKTDGNSDGSSSPLHMGANDGGGLSVPVADLVPRRTKVKVRTSSLTRKYPDQA
jgi:hypothetical protein